MKKKLVSILIANVLFLSNVGFTSFAVEQNMEAAGQALSAETEESEDAEAEDGEDHESEESGSFYDEDEIQYVKIAEFAELPEEITHQKIGLGGNIEELVFPDTLEIHVVADNDREERISRNLGNERRERELADEEAADAASSASSEEEDDASAEGSSGDDVVFFESDTDEAVDAATTGGESEEIYEEITEGEAVSDNPGELSTISKAGRVITEDSAAESTQAQEESENKEKTEAVESPAPTPTENVSEAPAESTPTESAPAEDAGQTDGDNDGGCTDAGTEGSSDNLIGMIKAAFKAMVVHAAESEPEEAGDEAVAESGSDETKEETSAETSSEASEDTEPSESSEKAASDASSEDSSDAEDNANSGYHYEYTEDEISVEMVSGIHWILDAERNDTQEFTAKEVGKEFIFVPILLIPDYYYIEAELPTITVEIVEEFFPFDQTVTVDDVKIRVRADKGVFPEGAALNATRIVEDEEQKVQDAIAEQEEAESEEVKDVVKSYTFDIQILDERGEEVEPDKEKGRVIVSFETAETGDEKLAAEIYHIIEAENTEESGEEKIADTAKENCENGENSDASTENYASEATQTVIVAVEKLESLIVDGEEGKAVEAETTSFSKYTVRFTDNNDKNEYSIEDKAIINAKEILANSAFHKDNNDDGKIDASDITGIINSVLITDANWKEVKSSEYLGVAALEKEDLTDYTDVEKSDGVYDDDGDYYFLIIKRPFTGTQYITINYSEIGVGAATTYRIKVTDNPSSVSWRNGNKYPYAYRLGEDEFCLKIGAYNKSGKAVFYQWQKSSDGVSWDNADIAGANCDFYAGEKDSEDKKNYWYRCCVNGTYSNAVQIITAESDSRSWTESYSDYDWCYVSNGTIAYTLDRSAGIFDIVGEYTNNAVTYMYQSTEDGNGWRIYSDSENSADDGQVFDRISEMSFRFDDSDPTIVHVYSTLGNDETDATCKYFSIVGDGHIGTNAENTVSARTTNGYNLSQLSLIGKAKIEDIQDAINRGTADSISSVSIWPEGSVKPYFVISDSKVEPYEIPGTVVTEVEECIPGISISWMDVDTSSSPIRFAMSFDGATANQVLDVVTKKASANSMTGSSAIKQVSLSGNTLANYAYDLGKPSEKVELTFNIKSVISNTSISNVLPKYTKSSTSTTSTPYTCNYFDASLTYKNEGTPITDSVFAGDSKTELPVVLTMEILYDFSDKEDIHVYRYHNSSVNELSTSNVGADGTYKIDTDANKIYIYASKFSTYAIAYKPITYVNVTFDSGSGTNVVRVKSGDKVPRPSTDPVKEGYTFRGWYTRKETTTTSSLSSSSTISSSDAYLYNFDNPVTSNMTLYAGWTQIKDPTDDASKKSDTDNDSRAPRTKDTMPIVWLWVLLLVAGVATFGCSIKELMDDGRGIKRKDGPIAKLNKIIWRLEIVIATTVRFFIKKLKKNKQKVRIAVSSVIIVISAIILANTLLQYKHGEEIYAEVEDTYIEVTPETIPDVTDSVVMGANRPVEEGFNWWDCANVSLKELKEEYPDVVGWIYFENEDISYPVMYSGDNSKYLRTTYSGEQAKAGSIFIDGESTPDFTDPHSIIYGHNMRDLSMFGKLRYYKTNPDYYEDHQYFQIFTENCVYRYQIFAYEEVADNDDVFWVYGKEPEGYFKMLKAVEKNSYHKTGITTNESDHVITLATCTSKDDQRLIVSAVRVGEYSYNQ